MEPEKRSSKSEQTSVSMLNTRNKFINLLFVNGEVMESTFKKTFIAYLMAGIVFLTLSIISYAELSSIYYS